MPIYEYQCLSCGHQFEVMQSISDKPPSSCPECKKRRIKKQVSATSFQLKGTGWYVTDFKNPPKKPSAETKAQAQESKESKSQDKTEGKEKSDSSSKEHKGNSVISSKNESASKKGQKSKD